MADRPTCREEVFEMERRLKVACVPVATMLADAQVSRATWQAMKRGRLPMMATLIALNAAVDKLAPKKEQGE